MKGRTFVVCAVVAVFATIIASPAAADLVTDISASASTVYSTTYPIKAVDGTGMTGGNHNTSWGDHWLDTDTAGVDGEYFVIDLEERHVLDATGTLKFWNAKWNTTSGLRQVKFHTSDDYISWTEQSVTIRDSGGSVTAVMPQGTGAGFDGTVDFGAGAVARYIKIEVDGGVGTGNYGHASFAALAQVQAWGTPTATASASGQIPVVSATQGSGTSWGAPINACNGTGLTGDAHAKGYGNAWMTNSGGTQNSITVDFGSAYPVQAMRIWNLNDDIYTAGSMKVVDVLASNDPTFTTYTTVFDDLLLPIAPPEAAYDSPILLDTRHLAGTYQYVRITNVGSPDPHYGSITYTGLSEVQFFQTFNDLPGSAPIPEPAGLGLIGLALLGLRKRRSA